MAYRSIENLYKAREILNDKECYAMEKIHGTSAHVSFNPETGLTFYAGGVGHAEFVATFDQDHLLKAFQALYGYGSLPAIKKVTVYGEAYGGKCQRMSDVYGLPLRFVAFEVYVEDTVSDKWENVPEAEAICKILGLEFVDYARIPVTLSALDEQRDRESVQAIRNGIGPGKQREGVVLRPIVERVDHRGNRVMAKHKAANFRETKSPREIDPNKLVVLDNAQAIADEWVTDERLQHVLQRLQLLGAQLDMTHTRAIINEMIEDVKRESEGEVVWSDVVEKSIGRATALLYKRLVSQVGV